MIRFILSAFVILTCSAALVAADDKANILKFDSGGSITAPEGYAWQKAGEQGNTGRKIVMFVAIKEGSTSTIFLALDPQTADTNDKRSASVKGFHNGILKSMHKNGATDIKAPLPDLKPPIASRVQFLISTKMKGQPFAICGVQVFGKNSYHMQFAGGSDDEALTLAKSAQSLKE